MGTLLLSYIRRLELFLGVQILIFFGDSSQKDDFLGGGGGVMICILGSYFLTF